MINMYMALNSRIAIIIPRIFNFRSLEMQKTALKSDPSPGIKIFNKNNYFDDKYVFRTGI